jgi:hypothetical protein
MAVVLEEEEEVVAEGVEGAADDFILNISPIVVLKS